MTDTATAITNPRVLELRAELEALEARQLPIQEELARIRAECRHPKLPPRQIGDEYMDMCPDCGHVAYCYRL